MSCRNDCHGSPEGPIYLRIRTLARLLDSTPGAIRKRLSRSDLPGGTVKRWGRSMMVHKKRFLEWLESEEADS